MKRTTLVAGLTAFSIAAGSLMSVAQAEDAGKARHHGPRMNIEQIDTNADGKISAEEMKAHADARFAEMDADGDGKVSPEELKAFSEKRQSERHAERQAKMIERLDQDGDGMLSQEEMTPKGADQMFEKLDTDGDGQLSEEELKAAKGKRGGHHKKGGKREE
ncbi:EF-hand domain-containing protein [Falsihalocynthiibacter sp. SS001]|uniref:EF-hand domain-containing protein n=1 Tax=Falsihalocynthiibacter sp. SS001 TaxID=3349698 RepID=UPI0036D2EBC7